MDEPASSDFPLGYCAISQSATTWLKIALFFWLSAIFGPLTLPSAEEHVLRLNALLRFIYIVRHRRRSRSGAAEVPPSQSFYLVFATSATGRVNPGGHSWTTMSPADGSVEFLGFLCGDVNAPNREDRPSLPLSSRTTHIPSHSVLFRSRCLLLFTFFCFFWGALGWKPRFFFFFFFGWRSFVCCRLSRIATVRLCFGRLSLIVHTERKWGQ